MMMVLWRKGYSWRDNPTNRIFVYLGIAKLKAMKKILLGLSVLVLIGCGGEKELNVDELTFKDGKYYYESLGNSRFFESRKKSMKLYSGVIYEKYENDTLKWKGNYKDGRFISLKEWDENGNLIKDETY